MATPTSTIIIILHHQLHPKSNIIHLVLAFIYYLVFHLDVQLIIKFNHHPLNVVVITHKITIIIITVYITLILTMIKILMKIIKMNYSMV
jgi:hypothetical protein